MVPVGGGARDGAAFALPLALLVRLLLRSHTEARRFV